jgi:hypothetical protein
MGIISFTKDPDEVLDYTLNWAARLVADDVISTSTWIVPDGVTKNSDNKTDKIVTIWLSGGTLNASYSLVNRIVTTAGRTMDQTCKLKIKAR